MSKLTALKKQIAALEAQAERIVGNVVPVTLNLDALSPSSLSNVNWANWSFATPDAPLQTNTTYTVSFQGSAGSTAIAKVWTFTTPAN